MIPKVLQRPTLVLNRNWQPVNVATVARALVLLWNETARAVDPADYQTYTWADWSKLRPRNGEMFVRAVRFRLRLAASQQMAGEKCGLSAVAPLRYERKANATCRAVACGAPLGALGYTLSPLCGTREGRHSPCQGGQGKHDHCAIK